MAAGHCFLFVGKDTGTAVAIIAQASAMTATIARTSATVGQGGRVTFRGFRHIILQHTWEEGVWVLVLRGRRINLLLIREGSGRLLFHEDFKDGAAAIKAKAESGLLMTCYHHHQPGHMRRDCPQRQGFQGFRTTQFQSSVG